MGTIVPILGTSLSSAESNALFGKTRNQVLALLFSRPERSFYLREIMRHVEAGTGAVQRELGALTEAGILTRIVQGRQVYYQANPTSPIFVELERIVAKTNGVTGVLGAALKTLEPRPQLAFIYGSFARGEQKLDSDVDLMLIGDSDIADLRNAQDRLGREIHVAVYPVEEFIRKAKARQHFITTVLAGPKLFIIGNEDDLRTLVAGKLHRTASDKR